MSSSRALAAARARRSNEQINPKQPPIRNSPGQSINSHASFVPQGTPQMAQGKNVRIAQAQMAQSSQQIQNEQNAKLNKISISDAIGLITLRLGRVENLLIEEQHSKILKEQNGEMINNNNNGEKLTIPNNMQMVEKEMITNMIARLDSLEKANRELTLKYNKDITELKRTQLQQQENIKNLNSTLSNRIDEFIKDIDFFIEDISNKVLAKDNGNVNVNGNIITTEPSNELLEYSDSSDDEIQNNQNIEIEFN